MQQRKTRGNSVHADFITCCSTIVVSSVTKEQIITQEVRIKGRGKKLMLYWCIHALLKDIMTRWQFRFFY